VQVDVSIAQLIVSIIIASLAIISFIISLRYRQSKFRLIVDPDHGYVSINGVITSTLHVKGNYRNKVILSVPKEPHGVHVAFSPEEVEPKGIFNFFNRVGVSVISISVSLDAKDGRYPIVVVGTEKVGSGSGASSSDGRWKNSCTYHLYCGNVR